MKESELIEETISFVKESLRDAEGGHDWFHTERVFKNTLLIAKDEKVDVLVVSLAALLHDIADPKFHDGDESVGPRMAEDFLKSLGVAKGIREHVCNIIRHMSFKNSLDASAPAFESLELFVVRDADRLDAIGAIGVARAFNYGGFKGRKLYDPEIQPNLQLTREAYKNSDSPTLNHFYEKLLLLKDRMHTDAARRLAEERHAFMLEFLEEFYAEWNGRA